MAEATAGAKVKAEVKRKERRRKRMIEKSPQLLPFIKMIRGIMMAFIAKSFRKSKLLKKEKQVKNKNKFKI